MKGIKKLSDTIIRKFVDTFFVSDWDIKTDTGWQQVTSVSKTIPYEVWRIETETGKFLECADDHIIFDDFGEEIFPKNLIPTQSRILCVDGSELVTKIERISDPENMYDLEIASKDHRFYTNNILSHNSVTTCAFLLWTILFKTNQNIAILANKFKTAQKLLTDLKESYMALPRWIQQGVKEWNKGNIELENGCKIMASSTSSDAIRGNAFNLIFLDEFAFVPPHIADDFFDSVYPTISSGKTTKIIIVSTPKGMNKFYRMWMEATNNRNDPTVNWNGFNAIEVHWSEVPGRDDAWKKSTIAKIGEAAFKQEFECDFIGSSNTLIDSETLKAMIWSKVRSYRMKYSDFPDGTRHMLDVHQEPQPNHQYVLCADVAGGKELDYSAFVIIDITTTPYYAVAKYMSDKISVMLYPD